MEALGSLSHKLTVSATDDVYQNTKERMAEAEKESKKQCAKEIKPSGKYISRRVRKVVKRSDIESLLQRKTSPVHHEPSPGFAHMPPHRRPSPTQSSSPVSSLPSSKTSGPHSVPARTHSPVTVESSKSHGSNHSAQPNGKTSPIPHNKSHIIHLPFRDRVIHLLAIRAYKKPEILARLHKDGIKEKDKKDKNSLGSVLQQVAQFNTRDNSYTLAKHLYKDVRHDWPAYTDHDRQILKRMMLQETSPSAGSSPVNVSPTHSTSSHGSPTNSQKRPTSTTDDHSVPSKKPRIAHQRREPGHHQVRHNTSPTSTTGGHALKQEATTTTPDLTDTKHSRRLKDNNNHTNHQDVEPANISPANVSPSSTSDSPDYIMKYTLIETNDQRQTYKGDFNSEYEEYKRIHNNVEKVTKRFKELHDQLKAYEEGTSNFESVRLKILKEYKMIQRDSKYVEQRRRCDYLHKKLGHIKKLILEYDQRQLMVS